MLVFKIIHGVVFPGGNASIVVALFVTENGGLDSRPKVEAKVKLVLPYS
jgi:hypothetical protein